MSQQTCICTRSGYKENDIRGKSSSNRKSVKVRSVKVLENETRKGDERVK